jgi:hypothetical protein
MAEEEIKTEDLKIEPTLNPQTSNIVAIPEVHRHRGTDQPRISYNDIVDFPIIRGCYFIASDDLEASADTVRDSPVGDYVGVKSIELPLGGTIRVSFEVYGGGGGVGTTYGKVYRNGGPVGTPGDTGGANWVKFTEDISGWSVNDHCELYTKSVLGAGYVRNFRIYCKAVEGMVIILD